jgi:RpiR family transcriptional regulator, carbohydrate utilization regulator
MTGDGHELSRGASGTMPGNLVDVIARALPRLSRSERKVAETILADPETCLRVSLASLARTDGVSEPTVVRFCSRVGFARFAPFRLQLASSLALGIPATQSSIRAGDGVDIVAEKIFDFALTSLDHARHALDVDALGSAIDLLEQVDIPIVVETLETRWR